MDARGSAVLGLVLASLFWAVNGVSWKLFLGLGFAFMLIFWVSRLFKFLTVLFISYYRVESHEPLRSRRELGVIFLNALFSVGTPLFFFLAIAHTKVSNAYFLQYTMSAWVLLAAILFLGERANAQKLLSFLLTIAGILFIARPEELLGLNLGVVFALLSAFSYTGDIITARELKDYSYHTISVYTNAMQFLITTAMLPFFFSGISGVQGGPLGFAGLVVLGILLGIASDLYYNALHLLEASVAGIIAHLELLFASVIAFLLFREAPTAFELIGYAAIFAASVIILLRRSDIANFKRLLHLTDKQ